MKQLVANPPGRSKPRAKSDDPWRLNIAMFIASALCAIGVAVFSVFAAKERWFTGTEWLVACLLPAAIPFVWASRLSRQWKKHACLTALICGVATLALLPRALPEGSASPGGLLAIPLSAQPAIRINKAPSIPAGPNDQGEILGQTNGIDPTKDYRVVIYGLVSGGGYVLQPTTLPKDYLIRPSADGSFRAPTHGADTYYALLIAGDRLMPTHCWALPSAPYVIATAEYHSDYPAAAFPQASHYR